MNQKVGIPIVGVVENESYFVCGKCSEKHELFGSGGGQKIAEFAAAPLLGQIPLYPEVRKWGDAGVPVVEAAPGSPPAEAFMHVARALLTSLSERAGASVLSIDRSGGQNRHLPITR
jgi:ATP-binding protein involved in chromosome partitioning